MIGYVVSETFLENRTDKQPFAVIPLNIVFSKGLDDNQVITVKWIRIFTKSSVDQII